MPLHTDMHGASAQAKRKQRRSAGLESAGVEGALRRAAIINATLVKLSTLDLDELDTGCFHALVDQVIGVLEDARTSTVVRMAERRLAEETHRFLRRREEAFRAREAEFADTVTLLTDAVVRFRTSNAAFTDEVISCGDRIRRISQIEDARILRERIREEADALHDAALSKQLEDAGQLAALRARVQVLESKLALATSTAGRDGLTGLFSRAAWESRMAELDQQLHFGDRNYAIAFIDLDHFKQVNDSYGHSAGDAVLQTFANLCRRAFGQDDFIARYGGDEFAVLLVATGPAHAVEHVQQLLNGVRRSNLEGGPSHIPFTLSIGVAVARPSDTAQVVLERADRALYAAKQAGRDRMVIAAP